MDKRNELSIHKINVASKCIIIKCTIYYIEKKIIKNHRILSWIE